MNIRRPHCFAAVLVPFLLFLSPSSALLHAQQAPYDVFPPADPPYYRVRYDASKKPGELVYGVNYTIWIPRGVKTLRGVIVHQHGCGEGSCKSGLTGAYDLHWQALAKKHDCALLAPAYEQPDKADCQMWCDPRNGSSAAFQKALADLGAKSGHPELAEVPWALWGHSGGGHWAGGMVLVHPERVAAAWLRSGVPQLKANPNRPNIRAHAIPDASLTVPMMCNVGTKEGVTVKDNQFKEVWPANEAFFNEVRGKGGLIGVAVDPLSSHECGNQRYLAIPWLDACLTARLPERPGQPLKPMAADDVWLAFPTGSEAQPVSKFSGDPLKAGWLPNATIARLWMQYVRDTNVPDTTAPPAPTNLRVEGNTLRWDCEADLESGLAGFLIERDGSLLATYPDKPRNPFGRPLFQNLQYSDTPTQPLVLMQFTDPSLTPGASHSYRVIAVNSVGTRSEPSAASSDNRKAKGPAIPEPGARGNVDNVPYIGRNDPKGNPVRLARASGHVSNYSEDKVRPYVLPDPLVLANGERVTSAEQWVRKRRPEILNFYREEIYGRVPDNAPKVTWEITQTDPNARNGAAIMTRVTGRMGEKADGPKFNLTIHRPANATGPLPVMLNITFGFPPGGRRPPMAGKGQEASAKGKTEPAKKGPAKGRGPVFVDPVAEVLGHGWAHASLNYSEIQPDRADRWTEGVIGLTLKPGQSRPAPDEWGTISAWAWGIRRAIDYLESNKEIDARRIAITGTSRLGKTVLWAAAQDERVAAVLSIVPGEMGASLIRRDWGETLDDMAQNFGYQFASNLQKWVGRWDELPVDQHMLIALCAPRPVYVNGGLTDQWSDPRGEFLAMVAAAPVYRLLGAKDLGTTELPKLDHPVTAGDLAFHYHSGGHMAVPADWKAFLDFAERHFREQRGKGDLSLASANPGDARPKRASELIRSVRSGPWSQATTWEGGEIPGAQSRVQVRSGHTVVYDLRATHPIRLIHVAGTLTFGHDRDTRLDVGLIKIQAGDDASEDGFDCEAHLPESSADGPRPSLEVGTPARPIGAEHTAVIRLVDFDGVDKSSWPAIVCCGGRMDFHGAPLRRTWVKLGGSARAGEQTVTLAEPVQGWRAGDRVIVTSTKPRRAREYQRSNLETEERIIKNIDGTALMLDQPLAFLHEAAGDFRGEVANLSRNVVIESAEPSKARGHTMYHRGSAGSISYAEFRHLGKEGVLGRYSLHFHRVGDTMRGSSVIGASIWDSGNRWLTIHGTNFLVVRDCVGYRSIGHGFFLEDGTEVNNVLERNLAVQALAGKPLPGQALPFDKNEGAGYWWANSQNAFTRNVACENERYGYRFEATPGRNASLEMSVMQPDGTRRKVDIRTLPFVRFDHNECHGDGLYGVNLGEGVERVGPDARHPFIVRNTRIWATHYAIRPQSPCVLLEDLHIHKCRYGMYFPNHDRHVYRRVTISETPDEPWSSGHSDSSVQYGVVTVDGLVFENIRSTYGILIALTHENASGNAASHFRNVDVRNWSGSDSRALVNLYGGEALLPPTPKGVPVYLHDYFGPNRHAKVVSARATDLLADGNNYRKAPPLTGDESQVAEVQDIAFPKLLEPVDDHPPTTVITYVSPVTPGKIIARGTSSDNGRVKRVTVNGREAKSTAGDFAEWEAVLDSVPSGTVKLTACAEDAEGNIEKFPHSLKTELGRESLP